MKMVIKKIVTIEFEDAKHCGWKCEYLDEERNYCDSFNVELGYADKRNFLRCQMCKDVEEVFKGCESNTVVESSE